MAVEPFLRAPRTFHPQPWKMLAKRDNAYARIQSLQPIPGQPDRLAFNDTLGVLYLTDTAGRLPTFYLDLRYQDIDLCVTDIIATGLLGFAFHPEFSVEASPARGKFYTAYTAASGDQPNYCDSTVIREWTTNDPMTNIFYGTSHEIFRTPHPKRSRHNIGTIAFNPYAHHYSEDYGFLYISLGDGDDIKGSAPPDDSQNRVTPQGSILRVDLRVDLRDDNERPHSPSWHTSYLTSSGLLPEIWAYGLRHPQNFSWDARGRMFINDIGGAKIEEINLGTAGGNYGWPLREGTFVAVTTSYFQGYGQTFFHSLLLLSIPWRNTIMTRDGPSAAALSIKASRSPNC